MMDNSIGRCQCLNKTGERCKRDATHQRGNAIMCAAHFKREIDAKVRAKPDTAGAARDRAKAYAIQRSEERKALAS